MTAYDLIMRLGWIIICKRGVFEWTDWGLAAGRFNFRTRAIDSKIGALKNVFRDESTDFA